MINRKPRLLQAISSASIYLYLVQGLIASDAVIEVHTDRPKVALSPVLYGLFFEDINYAADGGLYAELIQNRSFEFYPVTGDGKTSEGLVPLFAWQKIERSGGKVNLSVIDEQPLNEKNRKYLKISIQNEGTVGILNNGFDGIVLQGGAHYDFSIYAKCDQDNPRPVKVSLTSPDGEVLAESVLPLLTNQWKKYELELIAANDCSEARLELTTTGRGDVMLDMVSLFPQDTFRGRKNGLRKDLAQALADLKPGFLRFPGGCIVHGSGLANAYRWKDTIGDVAERRPNWNLWGYHQTYGLGYFEYMQLCEDIGATPLPVLPVGVACGFRQPFDKVPMDELQPWIDDALDLIEFANGPVTSEWGKLRHKMGHPEPFGLEYICLGNEEHDTPEVRERIPLFVEAIREKYPQIKIIGTSGLGPEIPLFDLMSRLQLHSSDEHYYMPPSWFVNNSHRFDTFDRNKPMIFVGEYASEGNAQSNAIAEAVYLTGIERNADIVDMTCYAPLLAKYEHAQWTRADLIWFDNEQIVRTPNYYVQQMFSTNKGDVSCANTVRMSNRTQSKTSYGGEVGIGTWRTAIEVSTASINDKKIDIAKWEPSGGDFFVSNGVLSQKDLEAEGCIATAHTQTDTDTITYNIRVRKTSGDEGFLIIFGRKDEADYYWWNVGGWRNTQHAIERRVDGRSVEFLASAQGSIEENRWYDLRVELAPGAIKCFIDGRLVHDYQEKMPEVYVSSTIDQTNDSLILKIVNPHNSSTNATINIRGVRKLAKEGTLTTLTGPTFAVNTLEKHSIEPKKSRMPVDLTTLLELPPSSLQVLRVNME
jgi:alpha-L-arabinofuranosidase